MNKGDRRILSNSRYHDRKEKNEELINLQASDGDKEGIVIGVGYNGVKLKLYVQCQSSVLLPL